MALEDPQYWDMLIGRSVSRFFLLRALYERPRHGYGIGKSVRDACGGCCDPSDAMIYPALRELLEGGYIDCREEREGGRVRKICTLTERGLAAYRAAAAEWRKVLPHLAEAAEQTSEQVAKLQDTTQRKGG